MKFRITRQADADNGCVWLFLPGSQGNTGKLRLPMAPVCGGWRWIIGRPMSTEVCPGHDATLRVIAGDGTHSFQWYKDGAAIGGAIGNELVVRNVGEVLAETQGRSAEDVARETTENTRRLFRLP